MTGLHTRHPERSIGCLCALFGKTREGYYSVSKDAQEKRINKEMEVLRKVREIREIAPGIGAYKLFLILKCIFLTEMPGRDRFYSLIHRHHLMLKPQKKRHTTNSNHNYRKYSNLIKGFKPFGINQLWVADITYIDTDSGVCYLHLLTDAYTHEIIGWVVSENLLSENTIAALDMALDRFEGYDLSSLIHHSDRGSQYCCNKYVGKLKEREISISMTEDSNPTDNAIAERVNGIIKQEWIYRMKRFRDLEEAREQIGRIIEFYNNDRPHMSNGMLTPADMRRMCG